MAITQTTFDGIRIAHDFGHCIVIFVNGDAHILDVFVKPEFRGRGYGVELVLEAVEFAKARQVSKAIMHTSLTNVPMLRIAAKLGFRTCDDEVHLERTILK